MDNASGTHAMNDKLGTRRLHHWRGKDRQADIGALADAVVGAVPDLFNRDGGLAQLNGNGELVPIARNALHSLIDKHIAAVRVVKNGTKWQREYYAYEFAPAARPDPTLSGPRPEPDQSEPDDKVLDEIYRHELLWRLPRVEQ